MRIPLSLTYLTNSCQACAVSWGLSSSAVHSPGVFPGFKSFAVTDHDPGSISSFQSK